MGTEVEGEHSFPVHEREVHRFGKVEGKPLNYSHVGALIGYLRDEGYLPQREIAKLSVRVSGRRVRIESPALLHPGLGRRVRHLDVEHRGEHYHFTHTI